MTGDYYTKQYVRDRYFHPEYYKGTFEEDGLTAIRDLKSHISFSKNIDYTPYENRKLQRYQLIVDRLKDDFGERVLDVGSRNKTLQDKLGRPCELVDKHNKDLPDFDWEKEVLPYENNTFDTVVCLDVLEHIENFHQGFLDLVRVSKGNIIVSLPNNWKKGLNETIKGRGRWASYGLPPEVPHDRHKWYFNTEDAEDFIYYNSIPQKGNYTVEKVIYHIPKTIPRIRITHPILKAVLPEHHFKNLFVETVFFVLKKK